MVKLAQWQNENPINYSLNGETADSFIYKTKATFEQIFLLLNMLRSAGAQAGLDATDAAPYQIRINTADNCLYMRDSNNEQWIYIGEITTNLGITPETIGAIKNGGNVGKISAGLEAAKPATGNATNDLYLATDSSTMYRWTGAAWDPGYFLLAYLSPDYMYSQGWETDKATLKYNPYQDDNPDHEYTMTLIEWYNCLNGISESAESKQCLCS